MYLEGNPKPKNIKIILNLMKKAEAQSLFMHSEIYDFV